MQGSWFLFICLIFLLYFYISIKEKMNTVNKRAQIESYLSNLSFLLWQVIKRHAYISPSYFHFYHKKKRYYIKFI